MCQAKVARNFVRAPARVDGRFWLRHTETAVIVR